MVLRGFMRYKLTVNKLYKNAMHGPTVRSRKSRVSDYNFMKNESISYYFSGKRLFLIAADHTNSSGEFIYGLKQIFSMEKPEIVLVEMPKNMPEEIILSITNGDSRLWNELQWSAKFSRDFGTHIEGLDMSASDRFVVFTKSFGKDGLGLAIYWDVVNFFSNVHKFGTFTTDDAYLLSKSSVIQQFLFPSGQLSQYSKGLYKLWKESKMNSLNGALDKILQDITDRYVEKKPLTDIIDNGKLHVPYPFSKKYKINKVNALIGAHRDFFMIKSILESLNKYDSIIVVVGGGHVMTIKDTLNEQICLKYGKCRTRKLNLKHP